MNEKERIANYCASQSNTRQQSVLGVPADRIGSDSDGDPKRMRIPHDIIRIRGSLIRGWSDNPRIQYK
jgi:hypothetical protein